ncbi:MAG TPA: GreA/GreB family elongation factor [Myxococcota bacterium]|nr:GreA/GreB family elongation factor [Myxococcota bacterium]
MASDNYITPVGLQRVMWELEWLRSVERPRIVAEVAWAASLGDRSENAEYQYGKRRLRQIDGRVDFLVRSLDRVQVVDPAMVKGPQIRFGATVVIADEEGDERAWRIYGEHEVDVDKGVLSHRSPLARALMGRKAGDAVRFEAPGGAREIEVVDVRYEAQVPDPVPDWKRERDGG